MLGWARTHRLLLIGLGLTAVVVAVAVPVVWRLTRAADQPLPLTTVAMAGLPGRATLPPRKAGSAPYCLRMRADNEAIGRSLPDDEVDLVVEGFRMLADGTRVRILWALIDRELSVNELAAEVGKPPASVSQHLAKLRMTRMLATRREGTQVFYRLDNEHIAQLVTDALQNAEHAGPGVPGHHRTDSDLVRLRREAEGA